MDPCEEIIIPIRVGKKPRLDCETQLRHSPAQISSAVSKVLDHDDLLSEILLRVCYPTTLVRAAVVCRRWLHNASDSHFLRRFRQLHPPRLLGFYHTPMTWPLAPRFVPILPQPLELAGVMQRATSSVDNYRSDGRSIFIYNCRNGNVLIMQARKDGTGWTPVVHSLLHYDRGIATLTPCQVPEVPEGSFHTYHQVLSKEEGDSLSYMSVFMESSKEGAYKVHVSRFHVTGATHRVLTIEQTPHPRPDLNAVLVGNKIYMPLAESKIIVLDLVASSFSTIHLPQGVEYGKGDTIFSPAHDAAGLYLIHVNQFQLHIWLHIAGDWLRVDTFCLQKMCANLHMDCSDAFEIKQVGDNAEFVFLEMGRWTLNLDIKRRTMHKLYEVTRDNPRLREVYPFVMIWPPKFPAVMEDLARNSM